MSSLVIIYIQSLQMLRVMAGPGLFIIRLHSISGIISRNVSQALKAIIQGNMEKLEKDIFISIKL